MKVIILCAGYATRLYPLTIDKPKPLLSVGGKLIIDYILDKVKEIDVSDVFVVTNDKFYPLFKEWNNDVKVINDKTISNDDRLGAIGDILYVIENEHIDDDVLVIAGDNLFEFSLQEMQNMFNEKGTVVAFRDVGDKNLIANKLGTADLDSNNKIIEFLEKPSFPKSTLAATACYMFKKEDLIELKKCIEENKKPDNSGDFIKYLISKKDVYAFVFNEKWFDIGSHDQLKEADEFYSE